MEEDWRTGVRYRSCAEAEVLLRNRQHGIARTLAGYAAERWSKLPSQKQAKHGAKMIEIARSSEVDVS